MKTMKNVSMLSLCGMLLGCATNVETEDVDPALTCIDRNITINHARGYLSLSQEYVEMCRGQSLKINIAPRVPNNAARATASKKNAEARWLNGSSGNGRFIEIRVPSDAIVGETYKFDLTIDEIGTLDPRVRVVR